MIEKTAIMLILEWADSDNQLDQYAVSKIKEKAKELLELEKKQIIDAGNTCSAKTALDMFNNGFKKKCELKEMLSNTDAISSMGEQYFTDTYEQPK